MIEITKKSSKIVIQDSSKKEIIFDAMSWEVQLDGYDVNHPGEYEKSSILLEVKEYSEVLFYNFLIDGKHLVIVTSDRFELKEEILSFFGDVDILVIIWSKEAAKVF